MFVEIWKVMKSLLKAFPIIFFIFSNNYIKAAGINCSSPVHKNKTICKGQSKKESKIDPKELIGKVTVSIVGIYGDKYPGSGVIVRKEDNIYKLVIYDLYSTISTKLTIIYSEFLNSIYN